MNYKNITLVQLNNERPLEKKSLHAGHNIWDALGMQRIGAVLNEKGHNVSLIQQYGQTDEEIRKKISETKPDIVGLSTWTCTWPSNLELAKKIKAYDSNIIIVAGGYHTSSYPKSVLEGNIDFGIVGEGEISFLNLVDALNKDENISSLEGLVCKEGGFVKINRSSRIEDLDVLPDPMRNPEMLKYTKVRILMDPPISQQKGVVMVDYSRGCVFACKYCDSNSIWRKNVKYRSPERVVNELKILKEQFGTNTAYFTDLTFNLNRQRTLELCDVLTTANLGIKFYVTTRLATPNGGKAKPLIDLEFLKAMKKAGVQKLGWGVETFSEEIKKDFRKDIDINYIKEVFESAHSLGLFNRCFLMLGHKDESHETIEHTIKMLKYLRPDELRLSFLTPFPGTPLWYEMKEEGLLLTEDLTRFTTNEPVIKAKLGREELIEAREKINCEYYNNPEYHKMVDEKLKSHPELKVAYEEFFSYLKKYEILK